MSDMTQLQQAVDREEGRSYAAYPDPLSGGEPWTCGAGCTGPDIHPGTVWNDATIDARRDAKIVEATVGLSKKLPWFVSLDDARRGTLILMAYQMGVAGTLAFKNTLEAVQGGRYDAAAAGMLASKWHQQTPRRAERMAWQMRTGRWWQAGTPGAPP